MCSYFSTCCEKESPGDLIQPGCSSAVQLDPRIAEGELSACRESHRFLGNAMEKAAVKCLWGCPASSCLPGVPATAPELCLLFLQGGRWGCLTLGQHPLGAGQLLLGAGTLIFVLQGPGDERNPLKGINSCRESFAIKHVKYVVYKKESY